MIRQASTLQTGKNPMGPADLQLWLDRVSRTFALTIRMLQEPMRTYAAAAYLVCRIVDTVEDCESLPSNVKCAYLREFCTRLTDPGTCRPDPVSVVFPAPVTWEEQLTNLEPSILALIDSFPAHIRDIIYHYVVEMAEGMVLFLEKQDADGFLHFETDEQLDRYCYYVAGTVGLMLNELFAAISGKDKSGSKDSAIELGIGLQLTNIVKDIQKDRLRNINYCPAGGTPHWQKRSTPTAGENPNWEMYSLASATISHLTGGKEYILGLESNLKQYKMFCVTNYLMAWKTLEACIRHPRTTAGSQGAKISRFSVYYTLLESRGCVVSDRFLNWRSDRLRKSCTTLVRSSDQPIKQL